MTDDIKLIKLGKIAKYSEDRISSSDLTTENYTGTDNILQNKKGRENSAYVPISGSTTGYHKNDILIANIRPYLQKIWLATKSGGSSADVSVIRVVDSLYDSKFVYYNLFQDIFFDFAMKGAKGSKMPRLEKKQILDFPIFDTEIHNQVAIATVLDKIDQKIALNNKISDEIEQITRLIYDYWFVQFEYPDENGRPYKSSGGKMVYSIELKRQIPINWKIASLNDIAEFSTEQINPSATPNVLYKYYSIPELDLTGSYVVETGDQIKSNKFVVTADDILTSKLNPWFKRVIFAPDQKNMICSTEFVILRQSDRSLKSILYMISTDESFIQYCTSSSSGTSNSHRRVNPELIKRFPVVYDENYARMLGAILAPLHEKLSYAINENRNLFELRDWLLPMLMTGQVKVDNN